MSTHACKIRLGSQLTKVAIREVKLVASVPTNTICGREVRSGRQSHHMSTAEQVMLDLVARGRELTLLQGRDLMPRAALCRTLS